MCITLAHSGIPDDVTAMDHRPFIFPCRRSPPILFRRITTVAVVLSCLLASADCAQAEKAGFEFFDTSHGESHHFQNMPAGMLLSIAPNAGFAGISGASDPEFRIIDIEIEKAGEKPDSWEFSGILLKNTGKYDRKSWFLWNLTEAEVMDVAKVTGWLPIDIEHRWYPVSGQDVTQVLRYAIVLAECPEKYEYTVLLDATENQVQQQIRRGNRPIEMDAFDDSLWTGKPQKLCQRFDAVFVENTGNNFVETQAFFATSDALGNLFALGYQLIDFEPLGYNQDYFMDDDIVGHAVMVKNGNGWWSINEKSAEILQEENQPHLRLIDLEKKGGSEFTALFAHQNP